MSSRRLRWLGLALVAGLALVSCSDDGVKRGEDGAVVEAGSVSVYDIALGDCLSVDAEVAEEVEKVDVVPCDEVHTHETYLLDDTTLDESFDVYPGAPDLEAVASTVCFDAFAAFVGSEVVDSALSFTYLYPTLKSWTENDPADRTIVCLVVREAAAGTVAGSEL